MNPAGDVVDPGVDGSKPAEIPPAGAAEHHARNLLRAARRSLDAVAAMRRIHIATAMLLSDNSTDVWFNLVSNLGPASVCAEQVALATLAPRGLTPLLMVSVRAAFPRRNAPEVVPPCGRCRELLLEYAPTAGVIVDRTLTATSIASLLPAPFRRRPPY